MSKEKGKYRDKEGISTFWLGALSHWQFTEESTEDMMVIAKIIRSIEQMVGSLDANRSIQVRLASERSMSSEWLKHKIVLPANYLWMKESFSSFSHIVDLWTAAALHEAGHIILSRYLEDSTLPASHEFLVLHIVEDFWIENWIVDRFPGYQPYFKRYKELYFAEGLDLGEDELSQRINDFLYLLHIETYKPLYGESRQAYHLVVNDWEQAKSTNQMQTWNRLRLGRDVFQVLFPKGAPDITSSMTEIKFNKRLDIEPAAPSSQQKDSSTTFPSPFLLTGKVKTQQMIRYHQEVKDGQKISWASEQMIDSWLTEDSAFQKSAIKNSNLVVIKRPDIDPEAVEAYRASYQRVKSHVLKLRRKFEKANTTRILESIRMQQGILDEEALYRTPFSRDLFKIEEETQDIIHKWDLTLLVDQSLSTERPYGDQKSRSLKRYEAATDLAVLFVEALARVGPIELRIYAFSTASHSSLLQLDELYSPSLKKKERLGTIRPKHATPEFAALKELTLKLSEEGRSEAKKLFLILSDGQPDDYQFGGGKEHIQHIKDWINKWSRKGYSFAHIALAKETKGKDIYPDSIHFEQDYSQLVTLVYRWISRILTKN